MTFRTNEQTVLTTYEMRATVWAVEIWPLHLTPPSIFQSVVQVPFLRKCQTPLFDLS